MPEMTTKELQILHKHLAAVSYEMSEVLSNYEGEPDPEVAVKNWSALVAAYEEAMNGICGIACKVDDKIDHNTEYTDILQKRYVYSTYWDCGDGIKEKVGVFSTYEAACVDCVEDQRGFGAYTVHKEEVLL